MTEATTRPVVVDMFCGSGGESQGIEELEQLAEEEERMKKESKTNEPWMGHAYANSAYLKAIALLRGDP